MGVPLDNLIFVPTFTSAFGHARPAIDPTGGRRVGGSSWRASVVISFAPSV